MVVESMRAVVREQLLLKVGNNVRLHAHADRARGVEAPIYILDRSRGMDDFVRSAACGFFGVCELHVSDQSLGTMGTR